MPSAYASAILAEPNLMHYWQLVGEADSKGFRPLTFGSAVSRVAPGRVAGDYAVKLARAGGSNSYMFLPAGASNIPAYDGAHSIEVLLKFGTHINTQVPYLISCQATQNTSWWLDVTDPTNPGMKAQLANWNSSAYNIGPIGNGPPSVFTPGWHHCVLAVGSNGSWEIFVDAVSIGSGVWNLSAGIVPTLIMPSCPSPFAIANIAGGGSTWAYDGLMQHLAIYSTKLTQTKVQAHVDALGTEPSTAYRAPYQFAAASYTRVYDFRIATLTKSLPRTPAVSPLNGATRAGRYGPPGGYTLPVGTNLIPPSTLGGVVRPGRMVGAPPGGWALPAPITPKLLSIGGEGGSRRPTEGQTWPRT